MIKKVKEYIQNYKAMIFFIKEIIMTQKEIITALRGLMEVQRSTDIKINYLINNNKKKEHNAKSIYSILEKYIRKNIGLHIRKIEEEGINNELVLDCIDMEENHIKVYILFYNNLTEEEIIKVQSNKFDVEYISKYIFYVGSISDKGRDLIEKTGMYIIYSNKYYPGHFDLN